MSTGNNKDVTIVTKKRKRVLGGYVHPNKPEIKRFDFFDGGAATEGEGHIHDSKEYLPLLDATGLAADQVGCYTLVSMNDPAQGTTSYQRVGMKYFLKYIKFKGHIAISPLLPFTIRYKLLLIKSDWAFASADDFFLRCYKNYEGLPSNPGFANYEHYCRHNFYKTYKWAAGMAEYRTSVMVVSSGTLSPVDYVPKPSKSSTLGSNPSYTYNLPDLIRLGAGGTDVQQVSYLPINVSVQVNDNVEVGTTHFYLMLMTDHGIGVSMPNYGSGTQYLYRATVYAGDTPARFNFFGCCYFTDL